MTENISLYVSEPDEFHYWIQTLELENHAAWEAEKREIHEAIFQVAREHEDEVVDKLTDDGEEDDGDLPDGHLFNVHGGYPSEEGDEE